MKANVGSTDKIIRILLAAAIVALYLANVIEGAFAIVLLILAGIFLLTSFISFCPIWFMLGINTKKKTKTA